MGTIVARKNTKGETRYRAQVRVMRDGKRVRAESKTFSKMALAKVELALAKGKRQYDKRQAIMNKELDMAARRAMRAAR